MRLAMRMTLFPVLVFVAMPAASVAFRGNVHTALGSATLSVSGAPPGDSLVVSNIGSSGNDGVSIAPADAQAPFAIRYDSIGSSAFTIRHRASEDAGGQSFVLTAVRHLASEPMAYESGGQPDDSYRVTLYSGPLMLFQSTPQPPGVLAESVLAPEVVVLVPGATGAEFSIEYIFPAPEELVYAVEQLAFTGDRIVIERIEPGGAAAGPPLSMDEVSVTVAELPELTILDETRAPAPIPLLPLWGSAALVATLLAAAGRPGSPGQK